MKPSKLLEHLARRILNRVGRDFANVKYARVKVKKMNPPLGGKIEYVAVELESE